MVTNDDSGVRHVEAMTDFFDVDDDIKSAWQCDDAVTPTGGLYATGASGSSITFYGLWHLNGQTVTCWCGGVDAGDYLVTNGAITVPIDVQPGIDLFTTDYLKSISNANSYGNMGCPIWNAAQRLWTVPCIVGFTFTSQGQTLRPDTQQESRSPTGPGPGKKRKEQKFAALLAGTQGIRFGTTFDNMSTAPMTSYPGRTRKLSLNQLFSGVTWASVSDSDTFDGMLCWQIDRPYPAAVVQLTGFMTMAGE